MDDAARAMRAEAEVGRSSTVRVLARACRRTAQARPIATSAAGVAALVLLAAWRDHAAEWQARSVWGNLEPVFEAVAAGRALSARALADFVRLCWGASAIFAAVLVVALWRRSLTLAAASAGAAALVWSWLWFYRELFLHAWWAMAAAASALAIAGWRTPALGPATLPRPSSSDLPPLLLVCGVATLARLYALTELPSFFIGEMGHSMFAPASWESLWRYAPQSVEAVSIGCAHLFLQWLSFLLFEPSVFAIRATAVVFGVATVWALYWFMRQSAGRGAALTAALLAAVAPEQLWWSRNENSYFIATCFAGVVTAWLAWRVRSEPSLGRIAVVCVWMALSRLFYLASVALFLIPPALLLHGVLFEPSQRRRLLKALLCVCVLGGSGWALSPSVVAYLGTGTWRFVHPARHGELVREGAEQSLAKLAYQQVEKIGRNAAQVGRALVVGAGFDHWYQRADQPGQATWINLAVAGFAACGLLLAVGQVPRPLAALLWLWLGAGLAPALLSEHPESRRLAAAYPAFYAAAGYAWAWWAAALRQKAGQWAARFAALLVWPVLAAVACSSAASHFALPIRELPLVRTARVVAQDFASADAIFYELDEAAFPIFAAVHANRWLERRPCLQTMDAHWLASLLGQRCVFESPTMRLAYSPETLEQLRSSPFEPHVLVFWVGAVPQRQLKLARLASLYPDAERECSQSEDTSYALCTVRVREPDLRRLRRVEATSVRAADGRLLRPRLEQPPVAYKAERIASQGPMRIGAALPVGTEGWFQFFPLPECSEAHIEVGEGLQVEFERPVPLLQGLVPFSLSLPLSCTEPLTLHWSRVGAGGEPLLLLDPALLDSHVLRSAPMRVFPGFVFEGRFGNVPGEIRQVRPTAHGVLALSAQGGSAVLYWLDQEGTVRRERRLQAVDGAVVFSMAASPDERALLLATSTGTLWLDGDGQVVGRWGTPELPTTEVVWLNDEQVVAPLPAAGGLVILNKNGENLAVVRGLRGRREPFFEPIAVARSADGQTWATVQTDGRLIVFRAPGGITSAEFAWERTLPLRVHGSWARGLVFRPDGSLLVADREWPQVFVYDRDGHRLLPPDPEKDWPQLLRELGTVRSMAPLGGRIVVLAGAPWLASFAPATDGGPGS